MSEVEVVIDMPAEYSSMVFGQFDEYAKATESNLNIELIARDIYDRAGDPDDIEQTKRIFCYGSHTFPEISGRTAGKIKGLPAAP